MSATTISAIQVRELRDLTGAGIMESKRALEEAGGDLRKAESILVQQGLAKAEKKAGRTAGQGLVEPYVHAGGRIASLVEINCETDFVARTDGFRHLAHDMAMQVAAMSPRFVSEEEIDEGAWVGLIEEFGARKTALESVSLLDQPFIKDPKMRIRDLVRAQIGKLGENIVIRRFARFEVGAGHPEKDISG
jgi:elongation factor Ts